MLKKALTKSGIRILKAIKKLSTKKYVSSNKKKSSEATNNCSSGNAETAPKITSSSTSGESFWRSVVPDHELVSLSWSLRSLDTKSVDTYLTMVSENVIDNSSECINDDEEKCCCCCVEYEENQRNENRENEMFR